MAALEHQLTAQTPLSMKNGTQKALITKGIALSSSHFLLDLVMFSEICITYF